MTNKSESVEYKLIASEMKILNLTQQIVELKRCLVKNMGLESWTYELYRFIVLSDEALGLETRGLMAEWLGKTELDVQILGGLDLLSARCEKRVEWAEFRTKLLNEFWLDPLCSYGQQDPSTV